MKKVFAFSLIALLAAPSIAFAQAPCSGHLSNSQAQQDQSQNPDDQNQNKKDKKKKKKDKGSADDAAVPTAFSEAVAKDVLQQLTDGLEGHSDRLMLSAFDDNKMDGYLNFEDQIEAFFQRYDSFRVHFRIDQATTEGDKGVVLVDIEMEEIPRSGNAQPVRKQDQMRFEMERGKKGWKIVDLRPRNFFS